MIFIHKIVYFIEDPQNKICNRNTFFLLIIENTICQIIYIDMYIDFLKIIYEYIKTYVYTFPFIYIRTFKLFSVRKFPFSQC